MTQSTATKLVPGQEVIVKGGSIPETRAVVLQSDTDEFNPVVRLPTMNASVPKDWIVTTSEPIQVLDNTPQP